jgi:hypothetical protein
MNYGVVNKCVDEVGHNFVVVGGFEDRPDHLNKKDYFRLYLQGNDKLYFGTDIEINETKVDMHEYLEPVTEVSNSGYMVYYPRWTYSDEDDEAVEVMADMVDIKQVLLDYGNRYIRAARYCFDNLRYRYPMQDWTHFTIEMSSGIISPLGEHGVYTQLYLVEDEYMSRRAAKHAMH